MVVGIAVQRRSHARANESAMAESDLSHLSIIFFPPLGVLDLVCAFPC